MFVDSGGWIPPKKPAPRKPALSKRQENMLLWLILLNAFIMLVAPIGGGTLVQAAVALFNR